MASKNNVHKDHRQRLKDRFLRDGLDGFELHNVLELLLFFSIPQCDTNELAHELLNRFGGISGVFEAPFEELVKINGVGDHTATMLKLIPEIFSVYTKEKLRSDKKKSYTVDDAAQHLIPFYLTQTTEIVKALYFDNKMSLVGEAVIFEGDVNSAHVSYKEIAKNAFLYKSANIIIAHNHPGGVPIPSSEDLYTTVSLRDGMRLFNINLVEHLLIVGNRYTKIIEMIRKREGER